MFFAGDAGGPDNVAPQQAQTRKEAAPMPLFF